jgi:hypothetical protein
VTSRRSPTPATTPRSELRQLKSGRQSPGPRERTIADQWGRGRVKHTRNSPTQASQRRPLPARSRPALMIYHLTVHAINFVDCRQLSATTADALFTRPDSIPPIAGSQPPGQLFGAKAPLGSSGKLQGEPPHILSLPSGLSVVAATSM